MDLLADHKVEPNWLYVLELSCYVAPVAWSIVTQLRDEIMDEEWLGHRHGERTTYKKGCHGPLCRKAMRDYGREYQRKANGHKRVRPSPMQRFDPVIEAYKNSYERWVEDSGRRTDESLLEVGAGA